MSEQPDSVLPPPAFSAFFKALLDDRGLSQAKAARKLQVAQSQVSRWRRGEGGISLENLVRIHEEFGVELNYLKQIAGFRNSDASIAIDSIEAERQLWRARYDDLIEKKVPRWAREAYIAACEALAEAYTHMRPGTLSTSDAQPLNKVGPENNNGSTDDDKGRLSDCYRRPSHEYHFDRLSAVPAG